MRGKQIRPLEPLCEESDQFGCSNAMHDASSQYNISKSENDNASTEYYVRLHFEYRGLNVAYVNICHMKPKLDEIKLLLNPSSKLDILGLCETFLDENTDDNILHMEGFNFECKDRVALKQCTQCTPSSSVHIKY